MEEARTGQKKRIGHRWSFRGKRPPGLCDKRFASAYIFAAVRLATGEGFALLLPRVSTEAMSRFLRDFADTVPDDIHAVMVLDGAGWHDPRSVTVPATGSLVALPSYSPERNPVERVWLYLREGFSRTGCWRIIPTLSMPAAKHETHSPPNPTDSKPHAPTPTSIASKHESGGIRSISVEATSSRTRSRFMTVAS